MNNYSQYKKVCTGRDFIADNIQRPFDLASIAQKSHMSPYHFSRIFKRTFGETPNEFLTRLRIEQAKKMLITDSASILKICESVGYASLGSFSSRFSDIVGTPPSLYRRKLWSLSQQPYQYPVEAIPSCYAFHFLGKQLK